MAFHYSPKVVTDGLVLTLDASNPKCMVNGASTATDLAGRYTLQGLSGTGLSVVKYTPSDAGNPAVGAVDFTNDGTTYPYIDDQGQFDFRSEISWMCIACKETNSGRQSIWSAIEDVSPWDGAGLISYSHDNNGKLAWWSGNNYGGWWDTSITLPTNKWVWSAGTWSGTTQKVWAKWDGSSTFETDTRTGHAFNNPTDQETNFTLGDNGTDGDDGSGPAGRIIDGAIAYVAIWSKALTQAEVEQNYYALKTRFGL